MDENLKSNFIIAKKSFPAGTVICREGEPFSDIFLLLKGSIQVSSENKIIKTIGTKGHFIGEFNPLFNQPRSTTLTAVKDSECLCIPADILENLISSSQDKGLNLLNIVAEKIISGTPAFKEIQESIKNRSYEETDTEMYKNIRLVARTPYSKEALDFHFQPMKYKVIYHNDPAPLIKDISGYPAEMFIFNAIDFPRHWKPLVSRIREKRTYEECIFILITDNNFQFEEAAKASHLRVNGIIPKNLLDKEVITQLYELLKRYKNIDEKRKFIRLIPKRSDRLGFLFTHPEKKILITGRITDISLEGLSFQPANPSLTKDLGNNRKIPCCSLRIGDNIIITNSRIARNKNEIGIEFESLETAEHHKLFQYLIESPERELKHAKSN